MKIRNGFVSNSSSSSFVLNKFFLSKSQYKKIKNHIEYSLKHNLDFGIYNNSDKWQLQEDDGYIYGYANMDNFDMEGFFIYLKIPSISFLFEDAYYDKKEAIKLLEDKIKTLRKDKINKILKEE